MVASVKNIIAKVLLLVALAVPFTACSGAGNSVDFGKENGDSGDKDSTGITSSSTENKDETNECVVTFDTNGGSVVVSQTVAVGEKIVKPANPSKASDSKYEYAFDCWCLGDDEWNFERDLVSEDITLTAKWKVSIYTAPFLPSD